MNLIAAAAPEFLASLASALVLAAVRWTVTVLRRRNGQASREQVRHGEGSAGET